MALTARRLVVLGLVTVAAGLIGVAAWAQSSTVVLRVALIPQWTIQQHRGGGGLSPALQEAVEGGVVDRTVYAWQRGVIQRQALVGKPIRVVSGPEGEAIGGRGRFDLVAVRPPTSRAAWTEVEVARSAPSVDDVLVLEIGGERNTLQQVLETLLVAEPGRGLREVPLARSALVSSAGVPIVATAFELPLPAALAPRFREEAGLGILVARSLLWDVRNGGMTSSGLADTAPLGSLGDWRDGDRVFLRVPAAALANGPAGLVLAWKDRKLQPDADTELPRRSSLPFPLIP